MPNFLISGDNASGQMTSCGVTSDDTGGIMTTLNFQCIYTLVWAGQKPGRVGFHVCSPRGRLPHPVLGHNIRNFNPLADGRCAHNF